MEQTWTSIPDVLGDTLLCSVDPKLQEDGCLQLPMVMDRPQPPWKLDGSNSELDPSKPFLLNFQLSLYFTFSSCFIFKLSATYLV